MTALLVVPEDHRGDEQRGSVRAGPACLCRCRSKLDPPTPLPLSISPSDLQALRRHSRQLQTLLTSCPHPQEHLQPARDVSTASPRPQTPRSADASGCARLQDASEWLRCLFQGLFRTSCNTSFILRSSQQFCFTGQILIQKITYQIQRRQTFYNSLCIK